MTELPPGNPSPRYDPDTERRRPRSQVSQVGRRRSVLHGIDKRTLSYRRHQEVYFTLLEESGADQHMEVNQMLARRAATLTVELENMDRLSAQGKPIDLDAYGQISDRINRLLDRLAIAPRHFRREPEEAL